VALGVAHGELHPVTHEPVQIAPPSHATFEPVWVTSTHMQDANGLSLRGENEELFGWNIDTPSDSTETHVRYVRERTQRDSTHSDTQPIGSCSVHIPDTAKGFQVRHHGAPCLHPAYAQSFPLLELQVCHIVL
jgi:hypothetical protein